MTIHSIKHGFYAGIRAFRLLLGNSHTRTVFSIGLLVLSAAFSFPVMMLITKFSALTITFNLTSGSIIWMILKSIFAMITFVVFSLLWSILIVESVLHPELSIRKLFSTSLPVVLSGLGYAAVKAVAMLILAPLYAISFGLFPVIHFFVNYLTSFFFVQVVDERTLFIDTKKYEQLIKHNLADYFGVWLFSFIVGTVIVFIASLVGLSLAGVILEYQFSFLALLTNSLFLFVAAFSFLFTFLVASTVDLVGVCLLYKDEKDEKPQLEQNYTK